MNDWLQIRGDPSIRQFLFHQERVDNEFDHHLDEVLARSVQLVCEYGIFHLKLHFSSGQVTLWLLDDPLRYRVHVREQFLDRNFCFGYTRRTYPPAATVSIDTVARVFAEFGRLRRADHHVYVRSASLNIVNGRVGLNFSCDGSHYLGCDEFLRMADDVFAVGDCGGRD